MSDHDGDSMPAALVSELNSLVRAEADEPSQDTGKDVSDSEADDEDDGDEPSASEDGDDADAEDGDDDESDDEDEGDEDDEETDDEDGDKPKRRSRSDRYKAQIARLNAENETLRAGKGNEPAPKRITGLTEADFEAEAIKHIGPKPLEKDFTDYLDFEREAIAWATEKRQAVRAIKAGVEATNQAADAHEATRGKAHKDRVAAFAQSKLAPDFDAVMKAANNRNDRVAPHVEELVLDAEEAGGHLTYYLAKNPEVLKRLNAMSVPQAAREIGRIEARLSQVSTAKPKAGKGKEPPAVTQAPKPLKVIKSSSNAPAKSADREIDSYLDKTYGKRR